jgi:hypothetical protein
MKYIVNGTQDIITGGSASRNHNPSLENDKIQVSRSSSKEALFLIMIRAEEN